MYLMEREGKCQLFLKMAASRCVGGKVATVDDTARRTDSGSVKPDIELLFSAIFGRSCEPPAHFAHIS